MFLQFPGFPFCCALQRLDRASVIVMQGAQAGEKVIMSGFLRLPLSQILQERMPFQSGNLSM
jgi:hypothetical protein